MNEIDSEVEEKIEYYEDEIDALDTEIRACMMNAQSLDLQRKAESENIEKLQVKRKKLEKRLEKFKAANLID